MPCRRLLGPLLGLAASVIQAAAPALAAPLRCTDLVGLGRPDLRIARAEPVPAGTLPADNPGRAALTGAARARAALPAHCLVEGMVNPRTGAGGQPFGIGFQLRLPEEGAWNGRLLFQGGGGLDGVVGEAVGAIPVAGATAPPALVRGYAVVSTDSGHQGRDNGDARFGLDQQARLDFAYASIGEVSREARALIAARHGRGPDRAYFMGCSNGGRSAMMAAQRFPTEFDGVVAGAPAFRLTRAAIAQIWDTVAFLRAAPRDAEGRPILAAAFSDGDLRLVAEGVLRACDAADGLADGQIDAMAACRFDPAALRCPGNEKADTCLAAAQVEALARAFGGARDGEGRGLYAPWPWDAGIAAPGWRAWKLGTSRNAAAPNARNATLGPPALAFYFLTPPVPEGLDPLRFDFDRDPPRTAQTAAINDPTSTMLSSFVARGGRMLVYHGNSDPVFSTGDLTAWWRELARDNGGPEALAGWARLFLVPGMTHCGGGPALDDFDPLTAIEAWVERGEAPDRLVARGAAFPGRSRPLCPYPLEARHTGGGGDPQAADGFACRPPGPPDGRRRTTGGGTVTQNIYDRPDFFEKYSRLERSVEGLDGAAEWSALRTLLPDLRGLRVVDLGCGFGWFCRWAREQGAARVLGFDLSERMLARAKADTADAAIAYVRADMERLGLAEASFDLAYSSLALHYVEDLAGLLAEVHRALRPGGRLVFSVEHPIFTAPSHPGWLVAADGRRTWPVDGYLAEGPRRTDWLARGVVKQHRTLGTTLNLLLRVGFAPSHVEEWGPTEEQVAARPDWADERERPPFLLVAARR